MQLHTIKREHPNKKAKRVGRGGKRGKTSGRGHKGQRARAGTRVRPEARDMIKKLPKLRGHGTNRSRTVNAGRADFAPVNVSTLEKNFSAGDRITPMILLEKKLVRRHGGKVPQVRILGSGDITKKFDIAKCSVSKTAKEKIEKAGGKIS